MPIVVVDYSPTRVILRLNRPDKLNALTEEMFESLDAELDQLETNTQLRTMIVTGEGRAFCAGTDLGELSQSADGAVISQRGQRLCNRIEDFPVPVIAAINGVAAGGGLELALACHLRIAAREATFSLPETKWGLIPGYGATQRLQRELGVGQALEMMLTGRVMTSDEALERGLVNRVVPASEVLSEAVLLAEAIARLSPLSIRSCLRAVIGGLDLPLREGLRLETELFSGLFATEDVKEGTRAFFEKRKPVFRGK